jgi:uncharacterized protein (UPF0276 family)
VSAGALEGLPALGVGVSLSFGMAPDPVALARSPGGPSFVEYAGAVQHEHVAGPVAQLRELGVPVLFHPSCLNLCGPWPNPPQWLAAVAEHVAAVESAWLAQDVSVCFVGDEPGYSIQLGYFVPPILTADSLDQAVARVREVRAAVPAPLLLEPAPVTFQLGEMSVFEWLGALAERTDCGVLLDAGHVLSHQLARGAKGLLDGVEAVGLERVVELHVAGGVIERRGGRGYYHDAHELPILPEVWALGRELLRRCPALRAVCIECEGAVGQSALPVLERMRREVVIAAASEPLRARVRQGMSA